MRSDVRSMPNRESRTEIAAKDAAPEWSVKAIESSLPFSLFMTYMVSFYLHFGERFPAIAAARPDFTLALLTILTAVPYVQGKMELFRLPVAKALNWLLFWIVVSLPFVEWPGSVLRENWQPFVKAVLFFYLTVTLVDTPKRLKAFVFMLLASQVIRVLEPLYLNLTEGYMGGATYLGGGEFAGRLSGAPSDVINPNGLGFVIATTIVFVHFMLWQARSFLAKLAYLLVVPGMLYALILSMSRGGFIALLVGGWLIFLQSRRKAALVVIAILAGLGSWNVMTDLQKDRYLSLVSDKTEQGATRQGRITGMIGELKLGMTNPVFGYGLGTTPEAKVNVLGGNPQASHNLYAELLIELGLVGFVLFMVYVVRIHRLVRENLQRISARGSSADQSVFFARLNRALLTTFWVYVVYSLNYFGLSQDYWYVFGGLCVTLGPIMDRMVKAHLVVRPRSSLDKARAR